MINFPVPSFQKVIICQFEEKNLAGAPHHESLTIDQEHLSKILVINLFVKILSLIFIASVLNGKHRDPEALPLPVEGIHFIIFFIVKALIWKIFVITVDSNFSDSMGLFFAQIVEKVVMSQCG